MTGTMRTTHTVAELELSPAAYDEISRKLREAQYDHCFMNGRHPMIDLSGIGITRGDDKVAEVPDTVKKGDVVYDLMHASADSCMSPVQRDLFDKLGEGDGDVYARLYRGITKRSEARVGPRRDTAWIDIVFDGPPGGPDVAQHFVEVEDDDGACMGPAQGIEWAARDDGCHVIRLMTVQPVANYARLSCNYLEVSADDKFMYATIYSDGKSYDIDMVDADGKIDKANDNAEKFERALVEIIDKLAPELDSGDILEDARAVSAAISITKSRHQLESLLPMSIDQCDKAPTGWECSRSQGHSGPCAASPVDPETGMPIQYQDEPEDMHRKRFEAWMNKTRPHIGPIHAAYYGADSKFSEYANKETQRIYLTSKRT
jgi:hypothetical protein